MLINGVRDRYVSIIGGHEINEKYDNIQTASPTYFTLKYFREKYNCDALDMKESYYNET